jgi:uncharacterized protein (DUF433 family)
MTHPGLPDWRTRIDTTSTPTLRHNGRSVADVLRELALSEHLDELSRSHPHLRPEDVRVCLAFAAESFSPSPETAAPLPALAQAATLAPPENDPAATLAGPPGGADAAVGQRVLVPGYEILSELGRGGMGVVYRARHLRLGRTVALKMILAGEHASPEMQTRFLGEARTVASLQHQGIVQIYEVGEHGGHSYLALEFVPGGSLANRLGQEPWSATEAANLVEKLARAIHAAHEKGVVHRDLKPENVLLNMENEPRITDFGLAKRLEERAGPTRTGDVMGTPSYMAPEQAAGRKDIGPAVDVYALGGILYRLLSGRPPFDGPTTLDILLHVLEEEPIPLRRLNARVPRDLETIAMKCLQKASSKRYASAAELADDLERYLMGEPIRARRGPWYERAWRWSWKHPTLAVLRGFLGLVLGSFFVLALVLGLAAKDMGGVVGQLSGLVLFVGFTRARPKMLGWGVLSGAVAGGVVLGLLFGLDFHLLKAISPQFRETIKDNEVAQLISFACMLPLFVGTLVGIAWRERWYWWVPGLLVLALVFGLEPSWFLTIMAFAQIVFLLGAVARLIRFYRGGTLFDILAGMNGGNTLFGLFALMVGSCLALPLFAQMGPDGKPSPAVILAFILIYSGVGLFGLAGAIFIGLQAARMSQKLHGSAHPTDGTRESR